VEIRLASVVFTREMTAIDGAMSSSRITCSSSVIHCPPSELEPIDYVRYSAMVVRSDKGVYRVFARRWATYLVNSPSVSTESGSMISFAARLESICSTSWTTHLLRYLPM